MNNIKKYSLDELVDSEKYLFHITDKKGEKGILSSGYILPNTFSGSPGRRESHSSLTENPISILEEEPETFIALKKNIILVFDKKKIQEDSDIRKVIYKPRKEFSVDNWWEDDRDFKNELEWRSMKKVPIKKSYIGKVKVKL